MLSSEYVQEMERIAQVYQELLVMALGIEAKKWLPSPGYYHPLTHALTQIIGWRKRFRAATADARQSRAMWRDWLENVCEPSDVYTQWGLDYSDSQWIKEQHDRVNHPERSA